MINNLQINIVGNRPDTGDVVSSNEMVRRDLSKQAYDAMAVGRTAEYIASLEQRVKELEEALDPMITWGKHSDHCRNTNGHPDPGNETCVCHIGKARILLPKPGNGDDDGQ